MKTDTGEYKSRGAEKVCRSANATPGLCVIAPLCQDRTLWVCSSPYGRQFLRRVVRTFKKSGTVARVSLLTENAQNVSKFANRMYVLKLVSDWDKVTESSFWEIIERCVPSKKGIQETPSPQGAQGAKADHSKPKPIKPQSEDHRTDPPRDKSPQRTSGTCSAAR